jgi:hypothetical protein
MTILNEELLIQQQVTQEAKEVIIFLHAIKDMIFKEIEETDDILQLRYLVDFLQEVEFGMQEGWNFPMDSTKHTWWLRPKKCTCPFMDNMERWGYGDFIVSSDCVLHG